MKRSVIQPRSRVCAIAVLVLLSACSAAAGPITYIVTVNTSTVNTHPGFLEFQFNGGLGSPAAVATLSSFTTDGTLGGPLQLTGNVTGDLLAGPLTFTNNGAFNDAFQPFTFGSVFSFVLSLSGPALSSPDATAPSSIFGVGLFDASGVTAILTGDVSGFAGTVNVNPDGTTTTTSFPSTVTGGPSVVSFQVIESVTAPEPGTTLLLGFGAAGLVLFRKIHRFFL